jgi:RNA polymerase sigma-70 factor (ECF subfamily)
VNTLDQELIDECLAGRTDAFGRLVVRHQDRLYNSLYKMLGSAEDARDASQNAFVQAFQKLNTFRGNSSFYSWLFRIAMNAAISQKRKEKRISYSIDAVREQSGIEPTDTHESSQPTHSLEVTENQHAVRQALSELAEEYRTVLVLKEMEGLKYNEIAEIVGCPVGTVRSRIHRARAELKLKLKPYFREESA